jgi:cytoskeletal protein RodZ
VILTDVSIGAALAEARHQAGLTVAEVSAHTRIREGLVRAIEQDEFGICGGDFYARGHIRAIAGFVGADPGALISEYDAEHPSGRPATLEELPSQPPSRPPRGPGQHRGSWFGPLALLLCIAAIVFVVYRLTPGTSGQQRPAAAASANGASPRPAASSRGPRPSPRSAPASGDASARTAPKATELTPVSAVAFGPQGTSDGDNPQGASLALSGDPATPWHTDWYTTARFGNLQAGTGLLLRLGRTVTATSVTIRLGNTPGADLQVRAGTAPAQLRMVAGKADAGGSVRLRLASHPRVRYVLIWFTRLPPDAAGTYQAYISKVTVTATSG